MPIVYNVVRIRDGGSFTTRTVDAIQNGEVIFNMIVSFQIDEGGFEHQFDMPDVPGPNDLQIIWSGHIRHIKLMFEASFIYLKRNNHVEYDFAILNRIYGSCSKASTISNSHNVVDYWHVNSARP